MKKLVILFAVTTLLWGCATGYRQQGLTGGFSESQLRENIFKISFEGNAYTSSGQAADYCLLRSAEVAMENGFSYFVIAQSQGASSNSFRPKVTNTVFCYPHRVDTNLIAYNAVSTAKSVRSKYGIIDEPLSQKVMNTPCHRQGNLTVVCADDSPWAQFNRMTLEITGAERAGQKRWLFETTANNDLSLSVEETHDGKTRKGSIFAIPGLAMATDLPGLQEGAQIDDLDGPILQSQLITSILHYAFPDGPKSISKQTPFEYTENTKGIRVATLSAGGAYPPPLHAKGTVAVHGEVITFDFEFSFGGAKLPLKSVNISMRGEWQHATTPPRVLDSVSLKGWNVYTLGAYRQTARNGIVIDYTARPRNESYETVGQLRKALLVEE
jgi:hypothetical protein